MYLGGVPLHLIIIIGIVIILFILLRGRLYKKIDHLLKKHFKFMSRLKPWQEKLIIIVVFIIVYIALRELIYLILGLFGIDFQKMIQESVNQSMNSSLSH
jgi:uncharacterized protein involved in cysteine biosynthesis